MKHCGKNKGQRSKVRTWVKFSGLQDVPVGCEYAIRSADL